MSKKHIRSNTNTIVLLSIHSNPSHTNKYVGKVSSARFSACSRQSIGKLVPKVYGQADHEIDR